MKVKIKITSIIFLCLFCSFLASATTYRYERNRYNKIYREEIRENKKHVNKSVRIKKKNISKLEKYKKLMDEIFEIEQDINTVKEFINLQNELKQKESSNRLGVVNSLGCVGLYQFCSKELFDLNLTVEDVKFMNQFKQDSLHMIKVKKDLKRIKKYCKKTFKKSKGSLIAGSHIGGAKGVVNFFRKNKNPKDVNGTSISDYVVKFERHELKNLKIK